MSELNKQVSVRKIKEAFNLIQVCGDDSSLDRWTIAPDVNRPGLELAGVNEAEELKRVVVIGAKEYRFIKKLDYETQRARFEFLTDAYTPCIIVTHGYEIPKALIDVANLKNFPVFSTSSETYHLLSDLIAFLSHKLAPTDTLHAGLLNIYGIGVMIMGESGIGKSELALDLIKRGHIFVADDVVDVSRVNKDLFGESPNNLKKMLEVRGIGVVDVSLLFGGHCFLNKCKIDFVIKLVKLDEYTKSNPNRLDPSEKKIKILGLDKHILEIPVTEGKSMSSIIETAVASYILKQQGIDSNELFKKRIYNEIEGKGE